MMKFFLFIIFLFVIFIAFTGFVIRRFKKLFSPIEQFKQAARQKEYRNVIYDKDDVIVLKGDAKDEE